MKINNSGRALSLSPNKRNARVYELRVDQQALREFGRLCEEVDERFGIPNAFLYVPFARYATSQRLVQVLGDSFCQSVREVMMDKEKGAILINLSDLDD